MNFGVTDKKQAELEARMAALGLREEDFEEKFVRSSGPGGQNVNKTSTCVVLKHVPSGLEVKMQKERSQPLNRYRARKRLCELMEESRSACGGPRATSPAALKAAKIRKQKQRRRRRSRSG